MRRYGIEHRENGVLTWSKADEKLVTASSRSCIANKSGMRPITTWPSIADALGAINATVYHWGDVKDFYLFAVEATP